MASEITISTGFTASKGGASIPAASISKTIDMTGTDLGSGTQAVGTSAEALDVGSDLGFPAHIMIQNLDGTNFVTVYQDSGGTNQIGKLRPGDPPIMLIGIAAVPYVKADTASCQVFWKGCEI